MTDLDHDDPPITVSMPESGTGVRVRNRAERKRRRRVQEAWFMGAVVVLTAAIVWSRVRGLHEDSPENKSDRHS